MRESRRTTFLLSTALSRSPGEEVAAEMATSSVANASLYRDASNKSRLLSFSCRRHRRGYSDSDFKLELAAYCVMLYFIRRYILFIFFRVDNVKGKMNNKVYRNFGADSVWIQCY